MDGFITALTGAEGGLTATSIWGAIQPVAPLVVTLVLVKIGYNVLRGTINNTTRPSSKKAIK